MSHSLNSLYRMLGVSKQAIHQQRRRAAIFESKLAELVLQVDILRSEHPGCGVEKMYYSLQPDFLGRDRFVSLMMDLGYRVKHPKNYTKTTFSVSSKYENLIKGLLVRQINQVVQTDISYILIKDKYHYLIFIIDVYSKRIVAYQASDHMRASANRASLKQMISLRGRQQLRGMIHHSDRGSQYNEKYYISLLEQLGCYISMGQKAQENAYAERINGIIKNEYLSYWKIDNLQQLKKKLKKAVQHYNQKRPHDHLPNRMSPIEFENAIQKQELEQQHFELIYAKQNYHKRPHQFNLPSEIKKQTGYFCPIFDNFFSK